MSNLFSLDLVDILVFDFDGVLTDNFVYVSEDGSEAVKCSRADGLAFEALRLLGKKIFILSSESNGVDERRAHKLGVPVIIGVRQKEEVLRALVRDEGVRLESTMFIGNDLNDYGLFSA